MEGGTLKALVILVLVSGMVSGQSTTSSFKDCYAACFVLCVIIPTNTAFTCSLECLKDCIIPKTPQAIHADNSHFCKLGCASSMCTNISTKQNPGGEEVKSCVGSCSELCTKNYLSP